MNTAQPVVTFRIDDLEVEVHARLLLDRDSASLLELRSSGAQETPGERGLAGARRGCAVAPGERRCAWRKSLPRNITRPARPLRRSRTAERERAFLTKSQRLPPSVDEIGI